jgi:SecD/SecF fusion protein
LSSASRWRVVAVVITVVAAGYLAFTQPVRLGLDLQGGTQIVLEAQNTDRVTVDREVTSRTLEVLRRRVDALGVAEPNLQRSGDRRIIVELPGVEDPDEAVEVIGRTAQLAFRPVLAVETRSTTTTAVGDTGADPDPNIFESGEGERLQLGAPAVTGDGVRSANARLRTDLGAQWHVEVGFRGDGGREWATLTGEAACAPSGDPRRRIAIVLDREVISSPEVSAEIGCGRGITGGDTVITGQFSEREAKDLALLIRAGALPVPVEIVEQRTIGRRWGTRLFEQASRPRLSARR